MDAEARGPALVSEHREEPVSARRRELHLTGHREHRPLITALDGSGWATDLEVGFGGEERWSAVLGLERDGDVVADVGLGPPDEDAEADPEVERGWCLTERVPPGGRRRIPRP